MVSAKARIASPWEVAIDRWLARAESEFRNRAQQGADNVISYFERLDRGALC